MNKTNVMLDRNIPDDSMCNISDVAGFVGISRLSVYQWLRRGKLPQPLRMPKTKETARPHLHWRVGDIRDWAREIGLLKDKEEA